ncbi:gntR-family transcriptional regulator [Vibrio ishigakensis]|uniref:GntR-family transcriptional regulator n=1 Tax=Vibrio ishigakensis TaxID=1481914 RepID=A0A0B8NXX8_9VIBR|nr:GntR family transcriptional regulator [Vibrio ishigakensis]GAM55564.1 gntR-family transcriptional regulator [Vibrio ishigakensis]
MKPKKYLEVYQSIKDDIINGNYPAWSQLEGEHALSDQFGVSRPTLRKAIDKLKQESFLHSRQGSGIFVNPPEFYQDNSLTSISEKIHNESSLRSIVLSFNKETAPAEIAKKFDLTDTAEFFHYKRMRIIDEQPAIIEETWMPVTLFPDFNQEACNASVLDFIENSANQSISHDAKKICGKILDDQEAFLLRVEPGHLCLSIYHHVYLLHSVLAQYTIETLVSNEITSVSIR